LAVVVLPFDEAVMPADYYLRQAARARRLAEEATTPAVRGRLREAARKCEQLADRVVDQRLAPG
jgi:hypothetical protein